MIKKYLVIGLLIGCLFCTLYTTAQTISGRVYSDSTKTAIVRATVYYGGSTTGTITDQDGRFELQAKAQQIPVVVSCIGYYSTTAYYKPGRPLIVYLKPKQEQLRAVNIRADGMDRKDEIAIFKREFLGASSYALSCTIENIDDIDFSYNRKTQILTASSDKPLIIENKKLGYTITYYLDQFRKSPREVYFAGNYIFKEDKWLTAAEQAKIKRNREDVYKGSRMQFIRALWRHTLQKTDFDIYAHFYEHITEDSIVVSDSLGQKYIKLDGMIIITYNGSYRNGAHLEGRRKLLFIGQDGFYNLGLRWSGSLGTQRIGDLLPFEYQSEKEQKKMLLPDTKPSKSLLTVSNISKSSIAPGNKEWGLFRSIVLMPVIGLDTTPVAEKWQQPIHYKIYSSLGATPSNKTLTHYIQQTFNQLSSLTACKTISETADSLVNFRIIIGKPTEFSGILPPDVIKYISNGKTNTCYYTVTENGFKQMVVYVDPGKSKNPNHQQFQTLWCSVKLLMMKCWGFPGLNNDQYSLFCDQYSEWIPGSAIQSSDMRIIKALYNPDVKPGMNEQEMYTAIGKIFPAKSGKQSTSITSQ